MMCVAFRLAAFPALDAFRLVFVTCFPSFFYFRRECRFQVSSAFVARMFFRLVLQYFLLLIQFSQRVSLSAQYLVSSALIYSVYRSSLLGPFFHGVLLLLSSCTARHFGLRFHIFYTLRSGFLLRVLLAISCSLSRFLFTFVLLTFSFQQQVPVQEFFFFIFFVCSSMFQLCSRIKHVSFLSSLFPRPFCFLVFYQFLSGVKASNAGTYGSSVLVQIQNS